jgi:chromosomal replication initiator protein
MREVTNTPFETIGDILGGRDHSTVMHGVNKIGKETGDNNMLKTDLKNIVKNLQVVE